MKYWPLKLKSTVRKVIHNCHLCFKMKPKLNEQFMGNLPASRVNPTRPFKFSGVDFAGPIPIKTSKLRNAPRDKAYIAVFVCMATKAVHLEVATALSTEAFMKVFDRFTGRRNCHRLISDWGTNFVGARNEFAKVTDFLKSSESQFKEYFLKQEIEWQHIPPRAPHMGGLWESAVKLAKFHLVTSIGCTALVYEDLNTLCIQIESMLNSRPLTHINDDPNDPQTLTPAHFLVGEEMIAKPQENLNDVKVPVGKLYRVMTQIQQQFWKRWSREVLREMQPRNKNFKKTFQYKVGQVVLIHEDNAPPLHWPMGIIDSIVPGTDNITRVVKVRLANGKVFTRAVTKISVLPILDEQESSVAAGEC